MNEQRALTRLQSTADTVICVWAIKLKYKLQPVLVRWGSLFNAAGEYDCGNHIITLNKLSFETLGFYQMERILRHELAHAICWTVYQNTEHNNQFAEINRLLGGTDRDG